MKTKQKKQLAVSLSVLSPLTGLALGSANGEPITGVLLGFIVLIIIGLSIRYTWDQWVLVLLVSVVWVLSSLQPFPIGVAYVAGSTLLGLGFAVIALRPLYGGNITRAVQAVLSLIVGEPVSTQVIVSPPTIIQAGTPEHPGPAQLVVNPNAVAVLADGAKQTAIVGPGSRATRPREYAQAIYNLRPQHDRLAYRTVLTRDLVPTDITVGLTYGIDVEWEAREGIRPLSRDERYAIQAFHVRAANWLEELKTVAESAVRTIVGKRGFRYATAPAYRKIIETEIANNMQFTAKEWGIRVYRMHLISIQPKEHVVTAREQRFISDTNAQTLERYEIARAKAWKEALNQLSEAYALAARNGLPDQIILRELLRRLMEQATSHATTQSMFPRELRHLFDDVDAVALSSPNGSSAAGANTPGP